MPSNTTSSKTKSNNNSKRSTTRKQEFLDFIDDSNGFSDLIPFSNRFHLSAARSDFHKVSAKNPLITESAARALLKYDQLDDRLQYLTDTHLLSQFKDNKRNSRIVISDNNYDETTLWRIHDAYRTDGAVQRSLDTIVEALWAGKGPLLSWTQTNTLITMRMR